MDSGSFDLDDDAVRALFAVPPDQFLERRAELAGQVKAAGDAAGAREIAKLRKPTVAAWIVNALVHADDTAATRIAELGDQLRAAQHSLDAKQLRELSTARRALVAELTTAALRHAERTDTSTTVQDEVRGTFDAAVADPEVTARLGRFQRAESFSGFGFGDASSSGAPPQLTLVRGGKADRDAGEKSTAKTATKTSRPAAKQSGAKSAGKTPTPEDAARTKALADARQAADAADAAVSEARGAEKDAGEQVRQAERALSAAKEALYAAKAARDDARTAHRAALAKRRDARRGLDRVEKGR